MQENIVKKTIFNKLKKKNSKNNSNNNNNKIVIIVIIIIKINKIAHSCNLLIY